MIDEPFANMRTWPISLATYCVVCTSAAACIVPSAGPKITFEHVPTDIRYYSSQIVEAAFISATQVGDAAGLQIWLVDVRVDRVIKGSINTSTVKLCVLQLGCRPSFSEGGHGIIVGETEHDPLYGPVLVPKLNWDVR